MFTSFNPTYAMYRDLIRDDPASPMQPKRLKTGKRPLKRSILRVIGVFVLRGYQPTSKHRRSRWLV